MGKNMKLSKLKGLLIVGFVLVICTSSQVSAQRFEYDEIRDPSMGVSMESLKAHQILYTMFSLYTTNVDTPGFVEQGSYNRRLKNGKIRAIPFYRWRAGPILETDRVYDFVVDAGSRGFFKVQLNDTTIGYTRDGQFDVDSKKAPYNDQIFDDGVIEYEGHDVSEKYNP